MPVRGLTCVPCLCSHAGGFVVQGRARSRQEKCARPGAPLRQHGRGAGCCRRRRQGCRWPQDGQGPPQERDRRALAARVRGMLCLLTRCSPFAVSRWRPRGCRGALGGVAEIARFYARRCTSAAASLAAAVAAAVATAAAAAVGAIVAALAAVASWFKRGPVVAPPPKESARLDACRCASAAAGPAVPAAGDNDADDGDWPPCTHCDPGAHAVFACPVCACPFCATDDPGHDPDHEMMASQCGCVACFVC